jgi:hypothetical protein
MIEKKWYMYLNISIDSFGKCDEDRIVTMSLSSSPDSSPFSIERG